MRFRWSYGRVQPPPPQRTILLRSESKIIISEWDRRRFESKIRFVLHGLVAAGRLEEAAAASDHKQRDEHETKSSGHEKSDHHPLFLSSFFFKFILFRCVFHTAAICVIPEGRHFESGRIPLLVFFLFL